MAEPESRDTTVTLDTLPALAITERGAAPAASEAAVERAELELGDILGAGGMGVVCSAVQVPLRREVAVKRLREEVASAGGAGARESLIQEALITGRVEHPNVIPVHMLGRDTSGSPVLVMKRIEGVSWRSMIRQPSHAAWKKVHGDRLKWHLGVLSQVANAVAFAHSRRVVHRDLKPENVMIGSFGEVYVLDWGIALPLDRSSLGSCAIDAHAGTPTYMAPEMARGEIQRIDERTDVYLLGSMLHEVLTGRPRHEGDSIGGVMASALESKPFPYDATAPKDLAAIANRATSADPNARFESAAAFREAIESYLERRESIALAEEALARLGDLERALSSTPASPVETLDPVPIYRLFGECRFGFLRALKTYPTNAEASRGLSRAIERMVDWELARKNVQAAAALLADLPSPSPDLERRIEEMRAAERRAAEEVETLRRRERDLDVRVGARERIMVFLGASMLIAGFVAVSLHADRAMMTLERAFWISLGFLAILAAAIGAARRTLLANEGGRRLTIAFMLTAAVLPIHRAAALLLRSPLEEVLIQDLLLMTLGIGITATTIERRVWPAAVWMFASFGWAMLEPGSVAETIFPVASVGSLVVVAWILRRD